MNRSSAARSKILVFVWLVVHSMTLIGCGVALPQIPITLRSLSIEAASIDTPNGHKVLKGTDLRELEQKIIQPVLKQLLDDEGPFRSALPGEASYELFIDFKKLISSYQAENEQLASTARKFFGLPIGHSSMEGYNISKIYAPDTKALVHETIIRIEHETPISSYRGKRYAFEDISSILIGKLREQVAQRQKLILRRQKIDSFNEIAKRPVYYQIDETGKIIYYINGPVQNNFCPKVNKIEQRNE